MNESVNFLSPIRLVGPVFNGCDFYADPEGPKGGMSVDVNIETPVDIALSHEDGSYVLRMPMRLKIRIRESADDKTADGGREVMHAFLSMEGALFVSDEINLPKSEILEALRVNSISLFYSSARSYIESLTGMSSAGRFTIPPIDPQAYVRSLCGSEA